MSQHTFTRPEVLVANERHLKYQGVAKVDVNQINFTQHETSLDTRKAERLRKIFLKEGCHRLDVRNHIPCTISSQHLDTSLERAGVTRAALLTDNVEKLPFLQFSHNELLGLHGRHRIEVARELLPPSDRWWTVDVYLDGRSVLRHIGRLG